MPTERRESLWTPPPPLSWRIAGGPSLPAAVSHASMVWRLSSEDLRGAPPLSSNPIEEYKGICEFMRLYATLRFYQLALLLGTTGSIVTALTSGVLRAAVAGPELLKAGGLIVSLALMIMEYRASSHWHRLRTRANALADTLCFQAFPVSSRWNPLTTSGAGFYVHCLVTLLWAVALALRLHPRV